MPLKSDYTPALPDDLLSEEGIQYKKAHQYYRVGICKHDIVFLVILTIISVGTTIALLLLTNNIYSSDHMHCTVKNFRKGYEYHSYHGSHDVVVIETPGVKYCGYTAAEARKLGCIFDTISFSWLVPECYDQELVNEFDKLPVKFPFYYNPDRKSEALWSEVVKGEHTMFVPWLHHLWHCSFL